MSYQVNHSRKNHKISFIILMVFMTVLFVGICPASADDEVVGTLDWPEQWTVFGPLGEDDPVISSTQLAAIPAKLEVGGEVLMPRTVKPSLNQIVTLENLYPTASRSTTAYIFLPLNVPEDREVTLGMGGNWWMQTWLNGELILDTTETSNIHTPIAIGNHQVNVNLRRGENVLAVRFICGSGGTEIALGGPDELRRARERAFAPPLDLDKARTLREAAWIDESLTVATGDGIILELERNYLRPSERYLEYFLELDDDITRTDTIIREKVFDLASNMQIHEKTFPADDTLLLRSLDLRTSGVTKARLRVELAVNGIEQGAAEALLHIQNAAPAPAKEQTIPINLDLPAGVDMVQNWPVTFGVPFPAGSLWDLNGLRLVDREGSDVPFQAETTALWAPDGAIRWVRFDALTDSERGLAVTTGDPDEDARHRHPLRVVHNGDQVEVDTGVARYMIEGGGALIREMQAGEHLVTTTAGRGLYVVDQQGRIATADATDALVELESAGPVSACVKIEGVYRTPAGEELARHITRLEFFAGRPETRVVHTLILTRDTNEIWFREIGWEIPVSPNQNAMAFFNTSATDATEYTEVSFKDGTQSASLFQAEGIKLTLHPHSRQKRWVPTGRGEYAFTLTAAVSDEHTRVMQEGERMGDWMLLKGDNVGLFMACRDAALQHPKEFEIFPDRMVMRLFSNRGGEELDFRSKALVERWGLTLIDADALDPAITEKIAAYESNAAGWSRTHQLTIALLPPENPVQTAGMLGRLQHDEVFAHTDPAWIHHSLAMGPVYPRDTERFPEPERMIEHYMRAYGIDRVPGNFYHGFVDYFAGPHYNYPARWYQIYDTVTGYWIAYARSGDREYRRTAQGAVRTYFDGRIAHWDTPAKPKGIMNRTGGPAFTGKSSLPYYWGDNFRIDWGNSTDLQRVLWDYYLTGYRRGRDIVSNYGKALLRVWRPGGQVFSPRPVLRLLYQAYELDWEPGLRVLAEATNTRRFFDPAGDMLSSKSQPYRCTIYKNEYDMDIPVEIWQLTGSRRYYEMACVLTEFQWRNYGISGRQSGLGVNFLYHNTRSPAIAADMAHFLRKQAGDSFHTVRNDYIGVTWSGLSRYFRGIPYAMDVVAATDADRQPLAALLDFQIGEELASVFLHSDTATATDLVVRTPRPERIGEAGKGLRLVPHAYHNRHPRMGQWLNQVNDISAAHTLVRIPYDSVPGAYEIQLAYPGDYTVIADRRMPLVVAPGGAWQPAYTRPATRFYFMLPVDADESAIRFENGAVLYAPDGTPQNDGNPVTGWQELPADQPGLWGFELTAPGEVEGRNFPQYFAMGDPEFYFEPEIVDP